MATTPEVIFICNTYSGKTKIYRKLLNPSFTNNSISHTLGV